MTLPPGPSMSRAAQTAAWIFRPGPCLGRARQQYGDAFTMTIGREPPWVVLSHPDAIREVFTGDPDTFHAGEGNEILLPIVGSRSVLLLDGGTHMQARKRLLPPFHGERMRGYEEAMREIARREIATLPNDEPLALLPRMQDLTLDVIMRTVFGSEDPRLREALRGMLDLTAGSIGISLMVALGPKMVGRTPVYRRVMEPVHELLGEHIRHHETGGDDVLSLLLEAGMEEQELLDELMTLLVAGHETTATALTWAIERLVRHPEAWERLQAGEEGWAEAVARETLRLRPVLPVVIRVLKRDVEIGGMQLPAGAAVTPCIWLLHRREDIYPDPMAFRPERFLGVKPGTYTWIPFGGGVRRCIGAAFAEMEMRVVLEELGRSVEPRPEDPRPEHVRRRAITFTPARGGRVVLGTG
jgi:cytochrome P450 family 135